MSFDVRCDLLALLILLLTGDGFVWPQAPIFNLHGYHLVLFVPQVTTNVLHWKPWLAKVYSTV